LGLCGSGKGLKVGAGGKGVDPLTDHSSLGRKPAVGVPVEGVLLGLRELDVERLHGVARVACQYCTAATPATPALRKPLGTELFQALLTGVCRLPAYCVGAGRETDSGY
jgi:hypothetical protein